MSSSQLPEPDLLDLVRWHIDRYDRLRASTSTRASVLLSANSVLLTGVIILANYRLQSRGSRPLGLVDIPWGAATLMTVGCILASITSCINAIATRRTTRSLHSGEIPDRFLFNWGDTLRRVDGYSSFADRVTALNHEAILGHGIAELWTDIMQHRRRHSSLRTGINLFRYCVMCFLALSTLTLVIVS